MRIRTKTAVIGLLVPVVLLLGILTFIVKSENGMTNGSLIAFSMLAGAIAVFLGFFVMGGVMVWKAHRRGISFVPARRRRGRMASRLDALMDRLARLCGRTLNLLSVSRAITVKHGIRPQGTLDYPRAVIKMVLDTPTQVYRLGACQKEPETVAWLESTFRPGDTLYDVGANVGAYSFVADAVAKQNCTVYAFEPSFTTFAALERNILINECGSRFIAFQIALGATTQLAFLDYRTLNAGAAGHRISSDPSVVEPAAGLRQAIPSFGLDDLIRMLSLKPPSHIKIDVDGAELDVLRGAAEIFAGGSIRHALIEVDSPNGAGASVLSFMQEHGYKETQRHWRTPERCANIIFAPSRNPGGE